MSAEVTVGVIGLAGAVIGATGAFAAGWVQQWGQANNAARERREQRALTAGDEALLQLVHLERELEMARDARIMGADPDHAALIRRFSRDAETALLRLPGAPDLRERMNGIFFLINKFEAARDQVRLFALIRGEAAPQDSKGREIEWALIFAEAGVKTLGAFLRGEELPRPERFEREASSGDPS